MSQVTATPLMMVVYTGASAATTTVMTVSISEGLAGVPSQNDMVLLQTLILMDTIRGVAGFAALPQQQPHSQRHIISWTYIGYDIDVPQVSFPFYS